MLARLSLDRHAEDREAIKITLPRLLDFQADGVSWLKQREAEGVGSILADEMGLGKTAQCVGLVVAAPCARPTRIAVKATLIVMTRGISSQWKRELSSFGPNLRFLHYSGGSLTIGTSSVFEHGTSVLSYLLSKRTPDPTCVQMTFRTRTWY